MKETIYQQINDLDIVHVVQATGVGLERSSNKLKALCPLHDDKDTPSFMIYPQTNSWTCFGGCVGRKGHRNGGGVFDYLLQLLGSHKEAIDWAKDTYPDLKTPETEPIILAKRSEDIIYPQDIEYWSKFMWIDNKQDFFIDRGFTEKTIREQGFGWDGRAYIIPIWEGKPFNSDCFSVKKRNIEEGSPKYIKFGQYHKSLLWGKYYNTFGVSFLFAGELDAALAVQHGLPALSVVDGMGAGLPDNWPYLYFSNQQHLVFCFDRKEARSAGVLASRFEYLRGFGTTSVVSMPPFDGDDYTDYLRYYSHKMFMNIVRVYKPDIDILLGEDY